MHPRDCPAFSYSKHPDKHRFFPAAVAAALALLRPPPSAELLANTRPIHGLLFKDLCPVGYEYYAGHYRGEDFRCLKYYEVVIRSDPRVGAAPALVAGEMLAMGITIHANLAGIGAAHNWPNAKLAIGAKLHFAVAYACRLFVQFLTIHPYADGNGHVARWMLIAVLWRCGYRLMNFPLEPRPPDPPYSALISGYRDGDVEPLERYILSLVRKPPPSAAASP